MSMRSLSVPVSLLVGFAFACDNAELVARRLPRASGGAAGDGAEDGGSGALSAGRGGNAGKAGSGSAGVSAGGSGAEAGEASGAGNDFGGAGNETGGDAGDGNAAGTTGGGAGGTSGGAGSSGGGGISGSAGTGGNGGSGGIEPTPVCDDGNPCTLDRFSDGACENTTLPDGTLCDDSDLCTLGDHCVARECVSGERRVGPMEVVGRVTTYGTQAAFRSVVVSPGDNRYVFVDGPGSDLRVTSTHLSAGALQTDGTARLQLSSRFNPGVASAFGNLVAIAHSDVSFSVGGDPREIVLVSLGADGVVTQRGSVLIGDATVPALTSLTGNGTRLFLCSNFAFISPPVQGTLHWIDVSNPDAPVVVATGALGAACGSIATSADATRVYVNTANGVRIADLSKYDGSGSIVLEDEKLVPTDSGLHARGDRLITRSGDTINVFDEPTRTLLHSFDVPGAHAAALTNHGIFIQSDRVTAGAADELAGLYSESGDRLAERSLLKLAYPVDVGSQKAVAAADSALFTLNNQLLMLDSSGISLAETPRVGRLNQLFAGPGDQVHSRSRYDAHRIDVSEPSNPFIAAGGPHRSSLLGIKFDESLVPSALVSEVDFESSDTRGDLVDVREPLNHVSSTLVERIGVDENEHYVAGTSFEAGGGKGALLSAGDFIYRAEWTSTGKVRFRRFSKSDVALGIAAASMDLELDAPAGSTYFVFDVDAVARRAALTVSAPEPDPRGRIHFIDLASDPPAVIGSTMLTEPANRMRIRGDMVVYTGSSSVHFRRRGDEMDESSLADVFVDGILAFDGRFAYLGGRGTLQVVKRGVDEETALVAEQELQGTPGSLVSTSQSLVVATEGELVTLSPACE